MAEIETLATILFSIRFKVYVTYRSIAPTLIVGNIMISASETDQFLVQLAQEGDSRAFDDLVRRYRKKLIRQVLPLVRDVAEAEDIAQEAFVAAFKSIKNFRGESAFSTWLYRIGINLAKHNLIQSNKRPTLYEDLVGSAESHIVLDAEQDFVTPESVAEIHEILLLLDSAMEKLPAEQREALTLLEIEGLTYEEIASSMHCPIGTVRSRVHRARDAVSLALAGAIAR